MASGNARRLPPPTIPDLVMLAFQLVGNGLAPFVPLYVQGLGLGNRAIGLLLAVPGAFGLLASVLASGWMARIGPGRLIMVSSVLSAVALAGVWGRPSLLAFVILMPLFWAVQPLIAVAVQVLVVSQPATETHDRVVGMHSFYASLGVWIGPLVASAAVHASGRVGGVFLAMALVSAAAFAIMAKGGFKERVEVAPGAPFVTGLRTVPPVVAVAYLAIMLAELCFVAWITYYPLALKQAGRGPEAIGVVFAAYGVSLSIIRMAMAWLVARLGRLGVLAASFALAAVGLWCSLGSGSRVLSDIAAVTVGLGVGLAFPITIVLVAVAAGRQQLGRWLAGRFFMITIGQIVGPIAAGVLAGFRLEAAFAAAAVTASAAAAGVLLFRRREGDAFLDTRKSPMLR